MIHFSPARMADDAELRAMLRENSMDAWIAMAVEREPSFFSGLNRFGQDFPMIARDGMQEDKDAAPAVGMFIRSEHPVYVNGCPVQTGYLGALRIDPHYRRQARALRDGYRAAFAIRGESDPHNAFCYTAIASENRAARRLLEAGLKGMPTYTEAGEIIALVMSRQRGKAYGHWQPMRTDECGALCALHNGQAAHRQFSPMLDPRSLAACGADFFVCRDGEGALTATMAIWNQQAYRQVVACAYRQPLAFFRPLYNLIATLRRKACLPPPGEALDQSYLAFFTRDEQRAPPLMELIADALVQCRTRLLTTGFSAQDAALPEICARFCPNVYSMRVYTVTYGEPPWLDARPVLPEVAVL